jgi:hypothetical protein
MLFKGRVRGGISLLIFSLILYVGEGCAGNEMCKPLHYQIWGYYPYWLKDEWQKIDLGLFDQVLFFDIPVSAKRQVVQISGWPGNWQELMVAAKNTGTRLQPTFTLFDAAEFERIFSNRKQRKLLQSDMLALIDQADSGGLQLDFEIFSPVAARSVKGFRLFLKSLKRELARRKKSLNLFVLAEDSAGLYDRKSLMNPDYIVIQGYDAHWKESTDAGPIVLLRGSMAVSWESSLKHYFSVTNGRQLAMLPGH